LPGPEAQQLATYIGWLMHRTVGGVVAGGLFIAPGIIAIMALSYVYAGYGNVPFDAPDVASVDAWALALSLAAAIAIFRFRVVMIPTLAACCAAGIVLFLLGTIA
jgi:chromate transporter